MEVAGVERGFYICSNCERIWRRYEELDIISSEWRWHDYLKKAGLPPSKIKVTKKKAMVIVEEENPDEQPPSRKEYLFCPDCGGNGIIHRAIIEGLKEEIDVCDECNETWEKGTAIQRNSLGLLSRYTEKRGVSLSKSEIKKWNELIIMEEDQV